jgi:anthranilate phosphoribosyltransferase
LSPVATARTALGIPTIFNLLGPLLNPGRPAYSLLGVATLPLVEKMAAALDLLGTASGLVAHGVIAPDRGIDELTTATLNHVRGAGRLRALAAQWQAADFGMQTAPFTDLQGGDLAANLALTDAVLESKGPPGLVDTIVLNAAVGLWITGRVDDVRAGLAPAQELLVGGAVARKIAATREFYR